MIPRIKICGWLGTFTYICRDSHLFGEKKLKVMLGFTIISGFANETVFIQKHNYIELLQ